MKKLTRGLLKANRLRNIVTILALALSTGLLFVTAFLALNSYNITSYSEQEGYVTAADGCFEGPSPEQIELLNELEFVTASGTRVLCAVGIGDTKGLQLYYSDEGDQQLTRAATKRWKGSYPEQKNEIMLSEWSLHKLGIDKPVVGMEITVQLYHELHTKLVEESAEETFILTGYYENGYDFDTHDPAFISEAFFQDGEETQADYGTCYFQLDDQEDGLECLSIIYETLAIRDGQNLEYFHRFTSQGTSDTVLLYCAVVAIIMLFAWLLIHNVFAISVVRDTRYYGLLKTIGVSQRQVKQLIHRQSAFLAVIGIGIGMLLSFPFIFLVPHGYEAGVSSWRNAVICMIFGVLFTICIQGISVRRSIKVACRVLPLDAIHYIEGDPLRKKRKKIHTGRKILRMAYQNIFRNKRRALTAIISMGLSFGLFMTVFIILNQMDAEFYVRNRVLDTDILINNSYSSLADATLDLRLEEIIEQDIVKIEGIEKYYKAYETVYQLDYTEEIDEYYQFMTRGYLEDEEEYLGNACHGPLVGISIEMFEDKYRSKLIQEETFDIKAFESGDVVLVDGDFIGVTNIPDTITITSRETGIKKEVAVAYVDYALAASVGLLNSGEATLLIGSQILVEMMAEQPIVSQVYVEVKEGQEEAVVNEIRDILSIYDRFTVRTWASEKQDMQTTMVIAKGLMGILCGIFALWGIMNFLSVFITGVFSRQAELSVLESLGMTRKQLKRLLVCEAVYYGMFTFIGALVFSALLVLLVPENRFGIFPENVVIYSLAEPAAAFCILAVICISVPLFIYRYITKTDLSIRVRDLL